MRPRTARIPGCLRNPHTHPARVRPADRPMTVPPPHTPDTPDTPNTPDASHTPTRPHARSAPYFSTRPPPDRPHPLPPVIGGGYSTARPSGDTHPPCRRRAGSPRHHHPDIAQLKPRRNQAINRPSVGPPHPYPPPAYTSARILPCPHTTPSPYSPAAPKSPRCPEVAPAALK